MFNAAYRDDARDIDELVPLVSIYAPSCAQPVIIHHLLRAAIKFCERTRCWCDEDEFTLTDDNLLVDIASIVTYSSLHRVNWATYNGKPLLPKSFTPDMNLANGYDDDQYRGSPVYLTQIGPNSLSVWPRPEKDDIDRKLRLSLFLKPANNAPTLPAFLFDQHADAIAHGALSTLMMMPNEPYTSSDQAMFYRQLFQQAMDKDFDISMRGQQRAPTRTKPHNF